MVVSGVCPQVVLADALAPSDASALEEVTPIRDKWAVVIGIDKFQDQTIPPLRFAKKDATDFAKFLVEKGNFAQDHILILTNAQATKYNIQVAIGDDWLPRRAATDDLIVFFASTHGSPKEADVAGENFLIAYDTDPKKLFSTAVKFADLAPIIKQRTGCQRIVLLLDACDSGAANVSKGLVRQSNFDVSNIVGEGQIVISSSSADQRSYESQRYENGVFTRQLISALQSNGAKTTLNEAFAYLQKQVENEVRYDRTATQTPIMRSKWKGGELILIAVPARPGQAPSSPIVENHTDLEDIFQRGKRLVEAKRYREALGPLQEASNGGSARAQVWLGDLYRNGNGVPQSFSKAAYWYQKSADQGEAAAQFYMGWLSATGNGIAQSWSTAATWYQKAANQGESAAQCNLGALYAGGNGVPQNFSKAAEWYQKSADQGNTHAQFDLAGLYADGNGVPQNLTKSAEWYQKAAGRGHAQAQYSLGRMYEQGNGVPQNESRALEWYRKSAAHGNVQAGERLRQLEHP